MTKMNRSKEFWFGQQPVDVQPQVPGQDRQIATRFSPDFRICILGTGQG